MTDYAAIQNALADRLREAGVRVSEWKPYHEVDLQPGDFVVAFAEPTSTSGWTVGDHEGIRVWSRIWDGHELPPNQPFARIRPA